MASRGINKVILVGNLGKDPEIRYLDQGVAVANFSLATTESYRKADGTREDRTEWHNLVMWRGLAETAGKYLKKGSTIYVEGRIVTRSWDDKESGQKKYRTEIDVREMIMLDGRPPGAGAGPASPPVSAYNASAPAAQPQNNPAAAPASQPATTPKPEVSAEDAADDLPF